MLISKLASAIKNDLVSGLRGLHNTMSLSEEQLEDEIIEERLQIIKEYALKGIVPIKDLLLAVNCVEIDCKEIAKKLHTDADIVFERLNFHLNEKYQYKQNDDSCVPLFYFGAKNICNGKHCIRFPYLCAILAHLEEEYRTQNLTLCSSIISIIISILTAIVHCFET